MIKLSGDFLNLIKKIYIYLKSIANLIMVKDWMPSL